MKTATADEEPNDIQKLATNISKLEIHCNKVEIAETLEGILGDNISDQDKLNTIYFYAQDLKGGF